MVGDDEEAEQLLLLLRAQPTPVPVWEPATFADVVLSVGVSTDAAVVATVWDRGMTCPG